MCWLHRLVLATNLLWIITTVDAQGNISNISYHELPEQNLSRKQKHIFTNNRNIWLT